MLTHNVIFKYFFPLLEFNLPASVLAIGLISLTVHMPLFVFTKPNENCKSSLKKAAFLGFTLSLDFFFLLCAFLVFSHNPLPFCHPLLFSVALFSLVNTIAQAVSCCRHFVADHGAESLLPSNCQSVHFMVHIPGSPFVRVPLAPMFISLTLYCTNNNKSNVHLSHLTVALSPGSVRLLIKAAVCVVCVCVLCVCCDFSVLMFLELPLCTNNLACSCLWCVRFSNVTDTSTVL